MPCAAWKLISTWWTDMFLLHGLRTGAWKEGQTRNFIIWICKNGLPVSPAPMYSGNITFQLLPVWVLICTSIQDYRFSFSPPSGSWRCQFWIPLWNGGFIQRGYFQGWISNCEIMTPNLTAFPQPQPAVGCGVCPEHQGEKKLKEK